MIPSPSVCRLSEGSACHGARRFPELPFKGRHPAIPCILPRAVHYHLPVPVLIEGGGYGLFHPGSVVEVEKRAAEPFGDHFSVAADPGRDNRQPAGKGLEKNVGPAFVARREAEEVRRAQPPVELLVLLLSREYNIILDPELLYHPPQHRLIVAFHRAAPDRHVLELRKCLLELRKYGDDPVEALSLYQPSDRDYYPGVIRQAEGLPCLSPLHGPELACIDAVGHDHGLLGQSPGLYCRRLKVLADSEDLCRPPEGVPYLNPAERVPVELAYGSSHGYGDRLP